MYREWYVIRRLFSIVKGISAVLLFSISIQASSSDFRSGESAPGNSAPIKILTNNWTSQLVLSKVVGNIFQSMGYNVVYIPSSTADQWGALAYGAAHVQVEVWQGTMSADFERIVQTGNVVDVGTHSATTREEWWYPEYVTKHCPGLPDWKALRACSSVFARPGSENRGIYFAGPWEKPDEARIRALKLDFDVVVLPKGDDLWVELERAAEKEIPIILFNWTPNWVESRYSGAFVEFPDYDPRCETEPEWGINPQFLYDCGNPKGGWLKKAAWAGMQKQWECAFKTLENANFSNAQIAQAAAFVDVDKMQIEQAAEHWMKENQGIWRSWIERDCTL